MDIDPQELIDTATDAAAPSRVHGRSLNAVVAITVALLATFTGICKVKDDNIVQAMQQAQADKLDHWAFYQARNLRQEVAEATVTQMTLARLSATTPEPQAAYDKAIGSYQALAKDQSVKKEALRLSAVQDQSTYDALNFRDDQFDLSDAGIAVAIALLAVTALTQLWPLYWLALVPTASGVVMGLAGLLGWGLHPDMVVRWLT
jgi:hypothetical protein